MSNSRWRRHADEVDAADERHAVPVLPGPGVVASRLRPSGDATYRRAERDEGAVPSSAADRMLAGIASVRADPLLAIWFEPENMAVPIAVSQSSTLLQSMSVGLIDEARVEHDDVELRAEWVLRSIVMLLAMPPADETTERSMVEQFLVPVLTNTPTMRSSA